LWENRRPAWSPDGETIAYQDFSNVWTVPASGGKPRRLTDGNGNRWPSWSADGRHVYFSSTRESTLALWRIPATGGDAVRLTFGTGPEVEPQVSRDGARLAYSTHVDRSDLVLVDVAHGAQRRVPDAEQAALSPDGRTLLFQPHGLKDLWTQSLEGTTPRGQPRRLTDLPGSMGVPAISPDGRWIAVHRVVGGQRDVWVIPAAGGLPEQITRDPANDVEPIWSPDGASIAFDSDRTGKTQIWIVPVAQGRAAGEPRQVTSDGAPKNIQAWSPDGASIAYLSEASGGAEVWVAPAAGGAPPRQVTRGADATCARWDDASGDLLVSGGWGNRGISLKRVPPAGGDATPFVPDVEFGNASDGAFAISRDGKTLVVEHHEAHGDVWVLDAPKGSPY
jgi:Tol biopolymer transport system component